MVHSLDRVVLVVPELEAAVQQYVRLLGRTPSWRGEQPAAGTQNTLFRLANTTLEIVAPSSQALLAEGGAERARSLLAELEERGEALLALVFGTDDADELHASLAERGLQPSPIEKEIDRDVESGAFRESRRVALSREASRGVPLSAVEFSSPDEVLAMSAALGQDEASVFAIDHAVVQTRDSEATKRLYGDGLALRLALERDFPQWGSRLQFFRVGGVTIEVAATLGGGESDENDRTSESVAADAPADHDRLWGLCWRVRDAAAARERMKQAGCDVSEVREGRKPGTRVYTVRDGTCGVPTLVIEPTQG